MLSMSSSCLEEKFEVIKDIGDGSFGSVALARVRTAGAHIAKRGTMVSYMVRRLQSRLPPRTRADLKLILDLITN